MSVSKTFSITMKGRLLSMDIEKESRKVIDRALKGFGESMQQHMAEFTEPHDYKGSLTNSLSWVAFNGAGDNASENALDVPSKENSVYVGSALPYAYVREYGAGPHIDSTDSDIFVADLKDWFKVKIGGDPDNDPDAKSHFYAILSNIRQGQDAVPFVAPTFNKYGRGDAIDSSVKALQFIWRIS